MRTKTKKQAKMSGYVKAAKGIVTQSQRGIGSHGRPKGARGTNQMKNYRYGKHR